MNTQRVGHAKTHSASKRTAVEAKQCGKVKTRVKTRIEAKAERNSRYKAILAK